VKVVTWCPCLLLLLTAAPLAAQTVPPPPVEEEPTAPLARVIHKIIVAKLPPVYENAADWGRTVPLPERMILPRLRRTVVQVGDRLEVPDGPWRRVRVLVEDPDRDIQVRVTSFKRLELMKYRVVVESDVALRGEADLQHWRNGVVLADLTARADVVLTVRVECNVIARMDSSRGAPRMVLAPTIEDLKLNLKEFTPRQVTFRRAGLTIQGEGVEAAGEEFKDLLQALLRSVEPKVKQRADDAIAQGLRDGKEDLLPAAELLKAVAPLLSRK
jgi:hypothetical protein